MVRFSLVFLFCIASISSAFSQLVVVPIPKGKPHKVFKSSSHSARVADTLLTLSLPFWDDFSTSNSPYYPDNLRWQDGESVSLNNGISINPPSLGAVSFDGLDSLGNPYDPTNSLSKGFGDQLVSQQIPLGDVPLAQRDSVYLSFFYQWQGNGEPPDPGDELEVDFKNNNPVDSIQWVPVGTVTPAGDGTMTVTTVDPAVQISIQIKSDTFNTMILAITDTAFYHNQFQFRIRTYGRISGPWDNWNVDYVYLNAHRFANDLSFPDRTIYSPLTSLFSNYWAIPAKHFLTDSVASTVLIKPTFSVTNLRQDQGPSNGQPINYSTNAEMTGWKDKTLTSDKKIRLDSAFCHYPRS